MTKDKRAKRDARDRKLRTDEPYVLARRESAGQPPRSQLGEADSDSDLNLDPADYDGGYGTGSYFARAMAKDD